MRIFFTIVCILIAHKIQSQSFDLIDEKVKAYPEFYSTKKLAKRINEDFTTDLEKARAIYYWITNNVEYDYSALRVTREKLRKNQPRKKSNERFQTEREIIVADYTIKNRIAVCDGYATLFKQLGDLTNVHSVIIEGFSKVDEKDLDKVGRMDHAWNAVLIGGEWYLVDSTWGAGAYDPRLRKFIAGFSNSYFMTNPELFFLNHYPKDKKWTLMEKTKVQFSDLPLFHGNYLDLGIEINSPATGVIASCPDEDISLEVKIPDNLLFYRFTYAFHKDEYGERMKFKIIDGVGYAVIQTPKILPAYLTLFYNGEGIVTYKVIARIVSKAKSVGN